MGTITTKCLTIIGAIVLACRGAATLAGASTSTLHRGHVPYGSIIRHCIVPGTVALTFDDGPYPIFTEHILSLLSEHGAHATFFLNGDNWGRGLIDDESTPWPALIRSMHAAGHQIGSHTYHHVDLSWASEDQRASEMKSLDDALGSVLNGLRPVYLRPPYGSCEAACQTQMGEMGYHVVNWDVDTRDFAYNGPELIKESMRIFSTALDGADPSMDSFLVLSHDVKEQTAYALTEFMLDKIELAGLRPVTVGDCLGDARENWYREGDESQDGRRGLGCFACRE